MVKAIMDRVFIRLDAKPATTKGGIFFTQNHEAERTIGTVISVGDGVKSVKAGDKVLFHVFDELPTFDENIVVVRQNSLLGVFEDE